MIPDFLALLPLLIVAAMASLMVLVIAVYRSHRLAVGLAIVGLLAGLGALPTAYLRTPGQVTPLVRIDGFALFYTALLYAAGLVIVMLAYHYWEKRSVIREEYYVLLLLAVLGSAVLAASTHFASFLLGLEILSVSLYSLVAYQRDSRAGSEAGIKYLILAGVSSAFILFGMALVYLDFGTMQIEDIMRRMGTSGLPSGYTMLGLGMLLTGIGFKLALAPFHLWTPDVYQGAPAPTTALIASVSKSGVFALLLRYLSLLYLPRLEGLSTVLALLALATMFTGNLLALQQQNLKRLLAYSSIAHMGYLLIALLASGPLSVMAVTFYLTAYTITILGAFGVIILLSSSTSEAGDLREYEALAWRRPWLTGFFSAMLLSLAGIPLTAGFIGKFLVITAGVGAGLWLLLIALVINSGIGLYYYLRVVLTMYRHPKESVMPETMPVALPAMGSLALTAVLLALIWLGIYPTPLIRVLQEVAATVFR